MPTPLRHTWLTLPVLILSLTPAFADPGRPLSERLAGFASDRYRADLAEISSRLDLTAGVGAVGRPGPVLDLAALHLAHGLWTEAGSLLDALDPDRLTASDGSDWARYRLLAALFDRASTGPAAGELRVDPDWPDAALFRALTGAGSGSDLEAAADLVGSWPHPAQTRALPVLMTRAIERESWAVLRTLSARMRVVPDLSGSPADRYLQGLAAERADLPEAALEAYLEAGAEGDVWAARARLAWARLALTSGLATPEAVRDHLESARLLWRGGEIGLETLSLLLAVTRDLDDPLRALDLVAEIRDRHPADADRVVPDEDAWSLMERFYAQGGRGEVPFAAFFEGHLRLFRTLATEPRYLDLVEELAERLAQRGAFRLAGEEYRRVLDTLLIQAQTPHIRVAPERLDRVRIRLAELLLDAGQTGDATDLLEDPVRDPVFMTRQEGLRARAFAETGDWEGVLTTWVEDPDPEHLRRLARAHHALSEWEESRSYHLDLIGLSPEPDPELLDRLLLASFRSGRLGEDEALIRPLIPEDALSLLDALLAADLPPTALRRDDIVSHLSGADALLEVAGREVGPGEDG